MSIGMCGRFVLEATATELVDAFALDGLGDVAPDGDIPPRYNIAPTQPIVIVRARDVPEGSNAPPREAALARWGLIPSWAKDPKDVPLLINARSETAAQKASFRGPMRHGRIVVPASGFYEWRRTPNPSGKGKPIIEPFYVRPRAGGLVAFAGLMSREAAGEPIDTAAILTVDANDAFRDIHHRMPIVIELGAVDRWLDCKGNDLGDIVDLIRTPGPDVFEAIPVSDRVNRVANQGPELIVPVEPRAEPVAPVADEAAPVEQRDLFG